MMIIGFHSSSNIKIVKDFAKESNFKDIEFSFKTRDTHKNGKNKCVGISVFGYKNKEKYTIYMSKNTFKRHLDLLLIRKEG